MAEGITARSLLPSFGFGPGALKRIAAIGFDLPVMRSWMIVYSRELLEYELKETERLNAMIVKQTRHCAELKAWEEAEEARHRT